MNFFVNRQIAFFAPADARGKWHAAWKITHNPVCGSRVLLGHEDVIRTSRGQQSTEVHPIVCRRCLALSTRIGVTGNGMEQ